MSDGRVKDESVKGHATRLVLHSRCAACGHALEELASTPFSPGPAAPDGPPRAGTVTVDNQRAEAVQVNVSHELYLLLAASGSVLTVTLRDGQVVLSAHEAAS